MGAMVKRSTDEVKGTAMEHDKEYIFRMASYQLGLNEARLNNAPYPQMPTMFPAAALTTTLTSSGTDNVRAREIVPKEVRDAINAYPKLKRRTWHTWRKDFVGVLSSLMPEAEDLLVMEPKPVPFDKRLDRALVKTNPIILFPMEGTEPTEVNATSISPILTRQHGKHYGYFPDPHSTTH